MSNNEKTKNKLMETMRMTKSDPVKKVDTVDTKQAAGDKTIKQSQNIPATTKKSKDSGSLCSDPYQTVQRVWPD